MTMPHASASLIPDHDDSGTFAPPPKKLKGEEEEENTPVLPMSQDSGEEDNSSVPMSQDSDSDLEEEEEEPPYTVENHKDFAKLKGEEEEENTPVVPMSQDSSEEEDNICVRKSQDSDSDLEEEEKEPPYTEEEAIEAFDLWCQMFLLKEYADQSEKEKRFKFFKDSLYRKVTPLWKRYALNRMALADQTPREAARLSQYCSITINQIHERYEDFKVHMSW